MPAIAPEPTRRAVLLAALAACLRADAADDVWQVLSGMVTGLSAGHPDEFLAPIDRAMPGFQNLRTDITALLASAEVQSTIELARNTGDDRQRSIEVDWLLRIQTRDLVSAAITRQEKVNFTFEKQGKRWRVTNISPASFFAPLPLR